MRFISTSRSSLLVIVILALFSCSKTEVLDTPKLNDFMPLQTGKYITYRMDSVVYTNFGRNMEIHKYQVKHVIDAQITDNEGRPAYRIYTYIRDSTGTQPWIARSTYSITPLDKRIEVIEDNLRFIKLFEPMKEGFTWNGNSYLSDDPYAAFGYSFALYGYMKDWDYHYDSFDPSFSYKGNNYTDVCTVEQQDFIENFPVTISQAPGSYYRAVEKYAKGVGLAYREYALMEYEPNPSGPSPYYTGFGITMWMIDHN